VEDAAVDKLPEEPPLQPPAKAARVGEEGHAKAAHVGEEGHAKAAHVGEEGHAKAARAGEEGHAKAARAGEEGHAKAARAGEEGHAKAAHVGEEGHAKAARVGEEGHAKAAKGGADGAAPVAPVDAAASGASGKKEKAQQRGPAGRRARGEEGEPAILEVREEDLVAGQKALAGAKKTGGKERPRPEERVTSRPEPTRKAGGKGEGIDRPVPSEGAHPKALERAADRREPVADRAGIATRRSTPPGPQAPVLSLSKGRYVLQLFGVHNKSSALRTLARGDLGGRPQSIITSRGGKEFYILYLEGFKSREEAQAAARRLPPDLQRLGPWPRPAAEMERLPR
jgi:septal ring-binding cell division protein DamX